LGNLTQQNLLGQKRDGGAGDIAISSASINLRLTLASFDELPAFHHAIGLYSRQYEPTPFFSFLHRTSTKIQI
jgi:hypothetical protein